MVGRGHISCTLTAVTAAVNNVREQEGKQPVSQGTVYRGMGKAGIQFLASQKCDFPIVLAEYYTAATVSSGCFRRPFPSPPQRR